MLAVAESWESSFLVHGLIKSLDMPRYGILQHTLFLINAKKYVKSDIID